MRYCRVVVLLLITFLLLTVLPALAGPIHDAAIAGDSAKVTSLLDADSTLLNARDDKGYTPLLDALNHSKLDVAALLIKRGADVGIAGSDGATPLMAAATQDAPTLQLLLDKGADIKAVDTDGWTALHYAATMGQAAVVRLLLAHGADSAAKTVKGQTPGDLAGIGKHPDVAALLAAPTPATNPFELSAETQKNLDNFFHTGAGKTVMIDGLDYSMEGGFAQTILDMNAAIAKTPDNPGLYIARGMAYTQVKETVFGKVNSVGNMTAASADFTKAIALDPKRADAFLARAGTYGDLNMTLADGEYPKALADADKAVEVAPNAPAARVGRGNFRLAAIDATLAVIFSFDKKGMAAVHDTAQLAQADFEKALALDPKAPGAHRGRGVARLQAGGDAALVQADLEQAVAEDPHDTNTLARLTNVASSRADWPAARKAADALIALSPNGAEFYVARAQIRVQQSDLDGALADSSRAVDLDTAQGGTPLAAALLLRAGILASQKKSDLAEADDLKAASADPTDEDAWDALARLQADGGLLDDAVATLRKGQVAEPNSSKLHLTLGLVLALKDDVPGSQTEYTAGIEYATPDAIAAQTDQVKTLLKSRPDSAGLKAALAALQAAPVKH